MHADKNKLIVLGGEGGEGRCEMLVRMEDKGIMCMSLSTLDLCEMTETHIERKLGVSYA